MRLDVVVRPEPLRRSVSEGGAESSGSPGESAGCSPAERSDGALLARFRTLRDESAFAELVRRHGPMVLGVCRRGLANIADAEDAFQATFLALVRRPADRSEIIALGPWLHRTAVLTVRKAHRSRYRRPAGEPLVGDLSRPDPAPTIDAQLDLDEALARLPERLRSPVVLHYLEGLSRAETASRLGCPEGTLSVNLARAKRKLRASLGGRKLGASLAVAGLLLVPGELAARTVETAGRVQADSADGLIRSAGRLGWGLIMLLLPKLAASVAVLGALVIGMAVGSGRLALVADGNGPPAGKDQRPAGPDDRKLAVDPVNPAVDVNAAQPRETRTERLQLQMEKTEAEIARAIQESRQLMEQARKLEENAEVARAELQRLQAELTSQHAEKTPIPDQLILAVTSGESRNWGPRFTIKETLGGRTCVFTAHEVDSLARLLSLVSAGRRDRPEIILQLAKEESAADSERILNACRKNFERVRVLPAASPSSEAAGAVNRELFRRLHDPNIMRNSSPTDPLKR
jgi:RNA polymerase sigma factor (sigma-70 family)